MPLVSPDAWSRVAVRAVIALCAVALLATASIAAVEPAAASDLRSQIAANRSSQLYSERAMRAQDSIIANIKGYQKATKRALRQARRNLKGGQRALDLVRSVVRQRTQQLATVEALFDDPADAPSPKAYQERLQKVRKSLRVAERRKATITRRVRAMTRAVRARNAQLRSLKRQRSVAISRREAYEGSLAARITQMSALAAARANSQATVNVGGSASFSWPTTGRISQTYGCTGFYLNPRRGSCRHFHDGVDIVDASGTPVRSVAVGVVAYAGWNPWDEHGRAWIIVVVHPDGWVSRYGHLTPTDRVRAGELVHTGQIIGKMGNTGRSTGTHLHFELLANGKDVNPMAYLPTGVIKVDKASTRQGQRALKAKQKAKLKARKKAQAERRAQKQALADEGVPEAASAEACEPAPGIDLMLGIFDHAIATVPADLECTVEEEPDEALREPSQPAAERQVARIGPEVKEPPGVPLPPRGTSPVPA